MESKRLSQVRSAPSESQSKTKVMAIGCIHGNQNLMERLAKRAKDENIDLIILAGDLTFAERSTENIIGPFAREKKQVLMVPGNHESVATVDFLQDMYSNSKNIHGTSFSNGNLGVFGAGGADIGIHMISEKEIFELLKKGNSELNTEKKIMVTHIHPSNTRSEFSGFKGSKGVRKAIDEFQPDIAVFAHIHEASGFEEQIGKTRLINVSRKEKVFEI